MSFVSKVQIPDWRVRPIYCSGLLYVFPTRNIVNFLINFTFLIATYLSKARYSLSQLINQFAVMCAISCSRRKSYYDIGKLHKYVCITTNQPDTKSNPNPNSDPTAKQHAVVSSQLKCPAYPEKFIRDNGSCTVVTTYRCHCHSPIRQCVIFLRQRLNSRDEQIACGSKRGQSTCVGWRLVKKSPISARLWEWCVLLFSAVAVGWNGAGPSVGSRNTTSEQEAQDGTAFHNHFCCTCRRLPGAPMWLSGRDVGLWPADFLDLCPIYQSINQSIAWWFFGVA